jgi:hypothetical protein
MTTSFPNNHPVICLNIQRVLGQISSSYSCKNLLKAVRSRFLTRIIKAMHILILQILWLLKAVECRFPVQSGKRIFIKPKYANSTRKPWNNKSMAGGGASTANLWLLKAVYKFFWYWPPSIGSMWRNLNFLQRGCCRSLTMRRGSPDLHPVVVCYLTLRRGLAVISSSCHSENHLEESIMFIVPVQNGM